MNVSSEIEEQAPKNLPSAGFTETNPKPKETGTQACVCPSTVSKLIYCDTETMGFAGIPFLIQYREQGGSTQLFHVLDQAPQDAISLIQSWCQPGVELVAYNAGFDIKMLSKLATVASRVSKWTFEEVWQAECLWRGDVLYADRLKDLMLFYPSKVTDLLVAAQSLPPLEEQFMAPPRLDFHELPVAALPELQNSLAASLQRQSYYSRGTMRPNVAQQVRWSVKNRTGRKDRERLNRVLQAGDYSVLEHIAMSIDADGIYSLKSVASLLGFSGPATRFEFLDRFGRISEATCPTYCDRDLYCRLFRFCQEHQHEPDFLTYARRDIDMLVHLDQHYRPMPGFECLEHNFDLVAILANLELYGVHVDPDCVAETRRFYDERVQESRQVLEQAGLANFNSADQVVRFVNKLLRKHITPEQLDETQSIDNIRQDTLQALLEELKGQPHKARARELLGHLVRARVFSRRPKFFDSVQKDTFYPQFRIKGTVSDRVITRRPTVQNMPARANEEEKEEAIQFRAPFTAPPGYSLLIGDADQFEMRLVAAECGETFLVQAFQAGTDPHSLTAMKVFKNEIRQRYPELRMESDEQLLTRLKAKDPRLVEFRGRGKILNFATIYGASRYGIARQAGTTEDHAQEMLDAFFETYPAIRGAIDASKVTVGVAGEQVTRCSTKPATPRVRNRKGLVRSFEIALRLVQILKELTDPDSLAGAFPQATSVTQAVTPYRGEHWKPRSVIRSQLSIARQNLEGYCDRQAFNFKIQSLGANLIKRLQARIAQEHIPPGLHQASSLSVLPSINVHDELHFYAANQESIRRIHAATQQQMAAFSNELAVPLKFEFACVHSWADKT